MNLSRLFRPVTYIFSKYTLFQWSKGINRLLYREQYEAEGENRLDFYSIETIKMGRQINTVVDHLNGCDKYRKRGVQRQQDILHIIVSMHCRGRSISKLYTYIGKVISRNENTQIE